MSKLSRIAMMYGLASVLSNDYAQDLKKYTSCQKEVTEPQPQKGQKYYCFRNDGTFVQYERDGPMLREEVVFKCYAINDKNAIKKFKKWQI